MGKNGSPPHVVVLGAGPAGVGAAFRLARRGVARVTVLEQRETVGGNAGSFELEGQRVDYGSHRLHPACDPRILADIRELLGDDLLDRPRHGRIRLGGRWLHFPLKPVDLALRLSPTFSLGVAADLVRKAFPAPVGGQETFASILERGLGRTICREFYFPYARKLWGLEPAQLSVTAARRRVSGSSLGKMIRKIASAVPGLKLPGAGRFFYPRRGYGQISERLAEAAAAGGAEFIFEARVTTIEREGDRILGVRFERGGSEHTLETAHVWSTLPVSFLARALRPAAPQDVLDAAGRLTFRGMVLIYLVLEQDRFTEFDAHYFPELNIPIARLSEPKIYCASDLPRGTTVLCAELPCDPGTTMWELSDEELGKVVCRSLAKAGIGVRAPIRRVVTRKLRFAYPVYLRGYEEQFRKIDSWVSGFDGLVTFGRQGLFAHDNTHHALYMAYAAVECFNSAGEFNAARWREFRHEFESHVVED